MPVIRCVEVGFGTLSFVQGVDGNNGKPIIKTFDSYVATSDKDGNDLSGGLNRRDTVKVQIGSEFFEIGPDAKLLTNRQASRVLNNSYTDSPQFKALLFGAIGMMKEPVIDVLGLGLPVNAYSRSESLKQAVIGEHTINGQTVIIKDVVVLPQPYGGLLSYANSLGPQGLGALRNKTIISVDPGFGTFDWLTTKGLVINDKRTGGNDMGFSSVLESVADSLKSAFPNMGAIPLEIIDSAFWQEKGVLSVAGTRYPFPLCEGVDVDGNPVKARFDVRDKIAYCTRNAISALKNSVREGADVELILVMGGPHAVYMDELRAAYPDHKIVVLDNSLTAVCEGIYIAAMQYFSLKQKQKGAA